MKHFKNIATVNAQMVIMSDEYIKYQYHFLLPVFLLFLVDGKESNSAMFFAKTKPWKFFDRKTAPCCLNWTPTIAAVCHPLLTERANTPGRITQPIMTEGDS